MTHFLIKQSDGEYCFIGHGWLKVLIQVGVLFLIKLFILHVRVVAIYTVGLICVKEGT